jgi:hypothetical protein
VARKNHAIRQSGHLPQILKLDTAEDETTAFHKELYWIHTFAGQGGGLKNREAQAWFRRRYDKAFGAQEPQNAFPASSARPRAGKAIPDLHPGTYSKVQALCSTLDANDITELETEWRAWLATPGKQPPKHPDAAFLAFCKRKLQT